MSEPHWIAKEIIRLRAERGWSQLTLASLADTTPATLGNFETGKGNMHLVRVDRVLEALGYEIDIHAKF
jgi:transcriptional regulator with XRE-family HTH domain